MEWCEGGHCVPPGYKFHPTEQELVSFYLLRKVLGFLDEIATIPVCDLYGNTNPWDLWEILKGSQTFNGSEVYVFTTLKRKSVRDSRVVRSVGLGCWSGEDAPKAVYNCDNPRLKIGSRKRFRFEKSGTEHDGGWIVIEYRLENSWLEKIGVDVKDDNIVSDLVICKLKKNTRRQTKSVSVVAASSSSVTEEENDKKRKREGLQADKEVSENNKRLKESDKTADNDESNDELTEFIESLEKDLLAVEYDRHDESKGREYEVNNEVNNEPFFNFGDFDFEGFDSNEIQWDDSSSKMFFDMDWLHENHPDLTAPSTDNLCNMNSQTSTATAVLDANEVFLL